MAELPLEIFLRKQTLLFFDFIKIHVCILYFNAALIS